jgi:hypothetical protein
MEHLSSFCRRADRTTFGEETINPKFKIQNAFLLPENKQVQRTRGSGGKTESQWAIWYNLALLSRFFSPGTFATGACPEWQRRGYKSRNINRFLKPAFFAIIKLINQ